MSSSPVTPPPPPPSCGCDLYHCSTINGECCCTHPSCVCKASRATGQVELGDVGGVQHKDSGRERDRDRDNKGDIGARSVQMSPPTIETTTAATTTTTTVEIAVGGMTCSMCSSAVEKAVRAMHGVTSCHVSLATNMATVVFSPIVIESQAIADEIEDIGYDVTDVVVIQQHQHQQQHQQQQHPSKPINATQRERVLVVELTVGGMTCSMCSSAVEKAVLSMGDGVVSCHVSLATNLARVVVRHDTDDNDHTDETRHHRVTPEMIREVIEDIGYDVTDLMVQQQQQPPPHRQLQQLYASNTNVNSRTRQQHHHASYDRDNLITGDCYRDSEGEGGQQAAAIEDDDRLGRILRQQDKQLSKRRREFFWSLVFVVPIMTITMVIPDLFPPSNCIRRLLEREIVVLGGRTVLVQAIVVWILTTPIQFVCGYSFYKTSYHGIMRGVLGMDVLVCVGTTSSYVYAFIAMTMNDQGYRFFETSAVLICFVLLGKWMNAMAVRRTSEALTQLMSLQPKTCIKVTPIVSTDKMKLSSPSYYHKHEWDLWNPTEDPYTEEVVPIQTIHPGDLVKILKGASIPADGVVLHGEMTVDQSMITGESIPVLKEPGDDVLGGTICSETGTAASTTKSGNSAGSAASTEGRTKKNPLAAATFVRVTGVGAESALSQIVQLVQEAQNRHVPIQTMADSIASVFVPVVVALSLLTFLAWYSCCRWGLVPQHWYGDESPATFSLLFGIAALVISCPCALGLATPTAVMVGTGVGAKHGILMKGGETLESASKVDAVIFDKTGTLTRGKPAVTDIIMVTPDSFIRSIMSPSDDSISVEDYLLWLLSSLERNSEHVLAAAIVKYAEEKIEPLLKSKDFAQATDFMALTGRGAHAVINGNTSVAVGNRDFAEREHIKMSANVEKIMQRIEFEGKTAVVASINGKISAVLGIADQVKDEAAATVQYLKDMGVDCWMVTGDSKRTAFSIAKKLNIPPDRVIAEALPSSKVEQVRRLKAEGLKVAMVGDGINDSPALAEADVGISMGTGAEIAAEASDMILVCGTVSGVVTALDLSRVIFNRIRWNFAFSMIYNILGIPLAAGAFFPILHTRLPPTVAAIAMALSSVSVVFSSLALRLYRPPDVYDMNQAQKSFAARAREELPRILHFGLFASRDGPDYQVVTQSWTGDFDEGIGDNHFQDEIV